MMALWQGWLTPQHFLFFSRHGRRISPALTAREAPGDEEAQDGRSLRRARLRGPPGGDAVAGGLPLRDGRRRIRRRILLRLRGRLPILLPADASADLPPGQAIPLGAEEHPDASPEGTSCGRDGGPPRRLRKVTVAVAVTVALRRSREDRPAGRQIRPEAQEESGRREGGEGGGRRDQAGGASRPDLGVLLRGGFLGGGGRRQ